MQMPGGLSSDAYLDRRLRPLDAEHFSAAGLLPFRKTEKGVELLLAKEKPWNSFIKSYDPLGWHVLGGKRIPRQERGAATTALRGFVDALDMKDSTPSKEILRKVAANSFVVWYPMGKYALIIGEVGSDMDGLPGDFEAKKLKQGSPEEFTVNEHGVKRWTRHIDSVEWVPAQKLVDGDNLTEMSDLLANCLKIRALSDFMKGSLDPDKDLPPPQDDFAVDFGGNGKGKTWGGGKKGGKADYGGGKGGGKMFGKKGKMGQLMHGGPMPGCGGCGVYVGKGMMMPPPYGMKGMNEMMMPQMAMPQMAMPQMGPPQAPQVGTADPELQRQMYGEQLYVLVQQLSPNDYIAQKITGMLLELPEEELHLNVTDQKELNRRVQEALTVLREDNLLP